MLGGMSASVVCRGCRREISGRYVTALGGTWHPDCFVCAACGQPLVGSFVRHDGLALHDACYAEQVAPRCRGCGQPIRGDFVTALEAPWHRACFVCVACHRPITGSFHVRDGQPLHPTCFAERYNPRCGYCRTPLMGRYLVDGWGTPFCPEHREQYAECRFCGRLVPEVARTRRAGRRQERCSACALTAVEGAAHGQRVLGPVIDWLAGQGVRLRQRDFPLRVLASAEFAQSPGYRPNRLGFTQSTHYQRNGRVVRAEVLYVAVLAGMPQALFEAVGAHEVGHVWLAQHGIVGLTERDAEGFCELLAHRYLTAQGGAEHAFYARRIAENDDPVYGDGFRALDKVAQRVGLPALAGNLRSKKRLP